MAFQRALDAARMGEDLEAVFPRDGHERHAASVRHAYGERGRRGALLPQGETPGWWPGVAAAGAVAVGHSHASQAGSPAAATPRADEASGGARTPTEHATDSTREAAAAEESSAGQGGQPAAEGAALIDIDRVVAEFGGRRRRVTVEHDGRPSVVLRPRQSHGQTELVALPGRVAVQRDPGGLVRAARSAGIIGRSASSRPTVSS